MNAGLQPLDSISAMENSDGADEIMESDPPLHISKLELPVAAKPKGILKTTANIFADRTDVPTCKTATFDEQNVLQT